MQVLWKIIVWAFWKSTGNVKYLFPSLRKLRLKFAVFWRFFVQNDGNTKSSFGSLKAPRTKQSSKCEQNSSNKHMKKFQFLNQKTVATVKNRSWRKNAKNVKFSLFLKILLVLRRCKLYSFEPFALELLKYVVLY